MGCKEFYHEPAPLPCRSIIHVGQEKYGISYASRKYSKSRSYIYFWKARLGRDRVELLTCQSRRPHSYPKQHTAEKLKLIWNMHRRNPDLGIVGPFPSSWRIFWRRSWTTNWATTSTTTRTKRQTTAATATAAKRCAPAWRCGCVGPPRPEG